MKQLLRETRLYEGIRETRQKVRHLWNGLLGPLPRPEKWVFIVGCYNSGTTLLHDVLASHPEVGSMPREGQYCTDVLLRPQSVDLPRLWALRPEPFRLQEDAQGIDAEWLKRQWGACYNDPARRVLLEKTTINAARTRWLQTHFEEAHFLGIVRNGYAVAEGIRRKAGHSLELAARQWLRSNEIMLEDFEHVENKLLMRYESLTEAPEDTIGEVLRFLQLPPGDLDIGGRTWRIHEKVSTIKNMNARSLDALTGEDRETIERVAGGMLQCLGYLL